MLRILQLGRMEKKELAERLAEEAKVPPSAAADELDNAIHGVIKNLRNRKTSHPNALQRLIGEANCSPDGKRRATS